MSAPQFPYALQTKLNQKPVMLMLLPLHPNNHTKTTQDETRPKNRTKRRLEKQSHCQLNPKIRPSSLRLRELKIPCWRTPARFLPSCAKLPRLVVACAKKELAPQGSSR